MARRTSLTPEVQKVIVDAINAGNYKITAAALAGVHRDSIQEWEKRGEAAKEGDEVYVAFLEALREAEANAESTLLAKIVGVQAAQVGVTGPQPWQAWAWTMERRWPKKWSGRVRMEVSEQFSALIEKLRAALAPDEFAKVVDAAREDAGGPADSPQRH